MLGHREVDATPTTTMETTFSIIQMKTLLAYARLTNQIEPYIVSQRISIAQDIAASMSLDLTVLYSSPLCLGSILIFDYEGQHYLYCDLMNKPWYTRNRYTTLHRKPAELNLKGKQVPINHWVYNPYMDAKYKIIGIVAEYQLTSRIICFGEKQGGLLAHMLANLIAYEFNSYVRVMTRNISKAKKEYHELAAQRVRESFF